MFNANHPFLLPNLPPPLTLHTCPNLTESLQLFNEAQKQISELKGSLNRITNPELFLNPFYLQESIQSNAVENIHTTIESAMKDEIKPENERKQENKEVINYRKALIAGWETQKQFGLSSRTIKAVHTKLAIEAGNPGEFRKNQNQIASKSSDGNKSVIYTPPIASSVESLISNWESYADRNNELLPLIKIAICHYQFEAIHPFDDGNGRAGRILMVLQFLQEEMLDQPVLFISSYLSKYEMKYKRLLLEVSQKGQWWEFIIFMIQGFAIQALKTKIILLKLDNLKKELKQTLYDDQSSSIRKTNINLVTDHLFQNPFTNPQYMAEVTNIHWQTCTKYLNYLQKTGILKKEKAGRYVFYANLAVIQAMREE